MPNFNYTHELMGPALYPAIVASKFNLTTLAPRCIIIIGLHGTYFMAKLLGDADVGRTDLLVSMALQPTAPSYAALLVSIVNFGTAVLLRRCW